MDSTSVGDGEEDFFEETVWIAAPESLLEGQLIYHPMVEAREAVLLLSPHPHFAGTMDNNVIRSLSSSLPRAGYSVLRFNYPGVGGSSIELAAGLSAFDYWDSVEKEQRFDAALVPALAAFDFLRQCLGPSLQRVHVVGYSFGAAVGLLLTHFRPMIPSVTAISMPWISRYSYGFLPACRGSKYFITGDRDFTYEPEVQARVWPTIPEPKDFQLVDDDHFFRQSEERLAARVVKNLLVAGEVRCQ